MSAFRRTCQAPRRISRRTIWWLRLQAEELPRRMGVDLPRQRPLTDATERHRITREHDAVDLRSIERLRIVVRALEEADRAAMLRGREQLHLEIALTTEQLRHLRLGPFVGAQLRP